MIRLNRSFSPMCLSPGEVQRLTQDYQATGDSVWNFEELKLALLSTSHGKCAYCECELSTESKYVEVEHYLNKKQYPTKVVEWENLLPSCKRCNGSKGKHDTAAEPILNPYEDDPRQHLAFRLYRLGSSSQLGESTLEVLNLNDPDRLVRVRFDVGEWMLSAISDAMEKLEAFTAKPDTAKKNRLLRHLRSILKECQPAAAYAATSATVLHSDARYGRMRTDLQTRGFWDDELEEMHVQSSALVLPIQ